MASIFILFLSLFLSAHGFSSEQVSCGPKISEFQDIQNILDRLSGYQEAPKCSPLKNGEFQLVEENLHDFSGNYLVRKEPDGSYKVSLNIDFRKGSGSLVPHEMLKRTKDCLALASTAIKGPDGQKMVVEVLSPDEVQALPKNMRPGVNTITIEGPGFLSHSRAYSEHVQCPIITHEIFHMFGLCDEYPEDRQELSNFNWQCRVVTKAPSIMRELKVFNDAVGTSVTCDCSGETCKSIMTGKNEALKNLYVGETFFDLTDFKFRNQYCRQITLEDGNISKMNYPDKNIVVNLTKLRPSEIEVENRFVTNLSRPPYYKIHRSKISCTCPEGDLNCQKVKKDVEAKVSRPGPKSSCPMGAPWRSDLRKAYSSGAHFHDNLITLVGRPSIPSLLQPNHFYKIIEGKCTNGKSKGYQECASFANRGPVCDVPTRCYDDSYYLGVRP